MQEGVQEGSRKGLPVQEGGFLWGSRESSWPGRGGVPVVLPVHILPSQFLAGFHFERNAKGRYKFE